MHQGKDTSLGIREALGYKTTTTITRHLKTLITANLVIREGELYRWVPPDTETLDEYAQAAGTAGKGEEAKRQHQHDREGYQAHQDYLAQKMTTSRQWAKERHLRQRHTTVKGHTVDYTTGEVIDSTEADGGSP